MSFRSSLLFSKVQKLNEKLNLSEEKQFYIDPLYGYGYALVKDQELHVYITEKDFHAIFNTYAEYSCKNEVWFRLLKVGVLMPLIKRFIKKLSPLKAFFTITCHLFFTLQHAIIKKTNKCSILRSGRMGKTFVKVLAEHDKNGQIRPLNITWTDGRKFEVDRVLDVRQAPSLKSGGLGIRYTCRIAGKEVYLFCDEGRWFIEH